MKNLKKVLLTGMITLATLFTMSIASKAATVKVTGDVINVRKEASIDSTVVAMLSKNVECEYLGEEGDWYKVKYQNYTGYVSKQYTELVGEISDSVTNSDGESNELLNNNEETNQNEEHNDNTQPEINQLIYKEFNQNTIIRILPLIYSSNIGETKKDDNVLVLTEASGWSYVQTDEISGWVRTDTLGEAETATTGTSDQDSENSITTEKIGYISEDDVNMRKGAGTSYSVLKVLALNTQVTILEEDGNWYKLKAGDITGYVSKDYVSDSKKVTSRSLSEPRTNQVNNDEDTESDTTDVKEDNTLNNVTNTTDKNTTTTTNTTTDKVASDTSSKNITTTSTTISNITTTDSAETTTSEDTIKGTDVIAYAKNFLGYKYVWAGDGSDGTFDCSGFTMYVYKHFGVTLPHYTVSQYNSSKGIKITNQSDLKMGDIVFLTDYETGEPCGHCGIYISNGDFIHADSSVGYVNISNLNGIYKGRFCGALRILN